MQTIIIDDEPLAIKLLAAYVEQHPVLTLAGSFTNPIDGLDYLQKQEVDLLLLDIQMPELNGLHAARLVRGKCTVIFTTAYEEHALKGYELDAVDYLLKPIAYQRFERAIAKAIAVGSSGAQDQQAIDSSFATSAHLFVKSGNRTHRLMMNDLTHASASGDYLTLFLSDGSKILTLENLSDFLARLPENRFCRIHRSHFVAINKIDFLERRRVVIGEKWLPISDGYREAFLRRIG